MKAQTILPGFLCGVIIFSAGLAGAAEPVADWSVKGPDGMVSKSLPLGALFEVRVNNKKPSGNIYLSAGTVEFDSKDKPVTFWREMVQDNKRNAVRILDTFTNSSTTDQDVSIRYTTRINPRDGINYSGSLSNNGEFRDYGNGVPNGTLAAIALTETAQNPASALFIWGQPSAPWQPTVQLAEELRVSYKGTIPAGKKVALVHVVATAGLNPKLKLERTFDLFWKNDRLVGIDLPDDIIPLVVNFLPEAVKDAGSENEEAVGGRLVALEETCEKLGLKRGSTDQLWLSKEEQLSGVVSAESVSFERDGTSLTFPLGKVAAIQGGSGRGGLHRLWLRDGSVMVGKVALTKASMQSAAGLVTLDAGSLQFILLSNNMDDARAPANGAAMLQTGDGQRLWLESPPLATIELITAFGRLKLPASEIVSIERKTEPPFAQQVALKDATRLNGVLVDPLWKCTLASGGTWEIPSATVQWWGVKSAWDEGGPGRPEKPVGPDSGSAAPLNYLFTRDGSRLTVQPGEDAIKVRTTTGDLEVKLSKIASARFEGDTAFLVLDDEVKMQGSLITENLPWVVNGQPVQIPTSLVTEFLRGTSVDK